MKIYDITVPIFEGMTVYKNKPKKQPQFSRITNAHVTVTESRIELDVRTGTHINLYI